MLTGIAKQVRDYISNHPSVLDSLKMGVVNHSALSRLICEELGIDQDEAVLAACRRFPVERIKGYSEDAIRQVLRKSRIETRTKMATITLVQDVDVLQRLGDVIEELLDENKICRLIQVSQGTVIIVDDDSISRVLKKLRDEHVIGVSRSLVELAVTSPENVEKTPGLLAFLSSTLASRGINIIEAMSCYTDTIFIVEQEDIAPTIEALTQIMR